MTGVRTRGRFALCGFYLKSLDGKGCESGLGWQVETHSHSLPMCTAFWPSAPPNWAWALQRGTPRGELDHRGAFPPHQGAFTGQTNPSRVWCRGWASPACSREQRRLLNQQGGQRRVQSSQCQHGSRAGTEHFPSGMPPRTGCSELPLPQGCAS